LRHRPPPARWSWSSPRGRAGPPALSTWSSCGLHPPSARHALHWCCCTRCDGVQRMDSLVVEKASILCYRLYDVADEIDLGVAESVLARDARRLRFSHSGAEFLLVPNPPLLIGLGRGTTPPPRGPVEVEARARLFDFGSISIVLTVPLSPGTELDALTPLADRLYDGPEVD